MATVSVPMTEAYPIGLQEVAAKEVEACRSRQKLKREIKRQQKAILKVLGSMT